MASHKQQQPLLPGFPLSLPGSRAASAEPTPSRQAGSGFIQSSPNVQRQGETVVMSPSAGNYDFAIYRFNLGSDEAASVSAGLQMSGDEVWIGISDYGQGRWKFFRRESSSTAVPLSGITYWSSDGNTYIAVISAANLAIEWMELLKKDWVNSPDPDSAGDVGQHTSLAIVKGRPAISYRDVASSDLKFVRASNAYGSAWGPAKTVLSAGTPGYATSLAVVDGFPAISYFDAYPAEDLA
ncbi:MAG: hypothetical protein M3R04_10845, partial [bacterium]|nr:hypothetical protein [bacterium]